MGLSKTMKPVILIIPVRPALQALTGLLMGAVSFFLFAKITAYTLWGLLPSLTFDAVFYSTVVVPLMIGVVLFILLRRQARVFATALLVAVSLLASLPIADWLTYR